MDLLLREHTRLDAPARDAIIERGVAAHRRGDANPEYWRWIAEGKR